MYGDEMGDLNVTQMKHDSGPGKLLFYRYFNQGRKWHPVNLHIVSDGQSKVDNRHVYIQRQDVALLFNAFMTQNFQKDFITQRLE